MAALLHEFAGSEHLFPTSRPIRFVGVNDLPQGGLEIVR